MILTKCRRETAVLELARALRKFAMQPVLELRRVGQFIQAAPVTAARLRTLTGVDGFVHRVAARQVVAGKFMIYD